MTTFPKSRTNDLVVQKLEKELLIYDLSINKAFCLKESLAAVWQYLDSKHSVAQIADLLSRDMKSLVTEEFIWLAIEELNKDDLIEEYDRLNNYFGGLSRREMVKKVGLTTMIALPLISSVVAPSAVMGASCFAPGTIDTTGCFTSSADCNVNFGLSCCSGLASNISQPCPLFAGINACACV